ncbi:MAG: flagellar biosynthesis protein FlhB [Clostridiales bacterium]|nr:flagellar biosynthesis protein FlhB [Clostridiales bacterium]
MAGDKTEQATPKRRRDERKKGNVFLSKDIVTVFTLIGSFYTLKFVFASSYAALKEFVIRYIGYAKSVSDLNNDFIINVVYDSLILTAKIVMPVMVIVVVLAIAATIFQTKPLFVIDSLKPKFSRLSPLQGIKRIISARSLVEVIKGIIKISILFYIVYDFIEGQIIQLPRLLSLDIVTSSYYVFTTIFDMVIKISIAFAVISVFDLFYQKWEYERQIRMSKQEIKEEYKQLEGDPKVKGKIKELQRKMAMSRMMQQVPDADVVIRNPTHFAVALKYNPDKDTAPVLVAKGQDELALRIVKVAEENNVFVIENKPLARAIFAATDLNQYLPPDFYGAVAEILVHVYKLNHKL